VSLQLVGPAFQKNYRPTFSLECESKNDIETDLWLQSGSFKISRLGKEVREIIRETAELRWFGNLAPFVPGPIGATPKPKRKRKLTPVQVRAAHNQRMQWRQESLLALRRKNDLVLKGGR
jgi:hypothetical protein